MFIKSVLIFCYITAVTCDKHEDLRNGKIISFDASKGDFEVGLDFSLPFLKIPIKSQGDAETPYAHHGLNLPKINVNLSSLLVGGMILLLTTVISPLLSKSFAMHHWDRSSRVSENESGYNPLLDFSHQMVTKNSGCLERVACTSSQHLQDINTLRSMKLILRNNLLSSILNTTALEEAADYGLHRDDCERYGPCLLGKDDFLKVMTNIASTNAVKNANYRST